MPLTTRPVLTLHVADRASTKAEKRRVIRRVPAAGNVTPGRITPGFIMDEGGQMGGRFYKSAEPLGYPPEPKRGSWYCPPRRKSIMRPVSAPSASSQMRPPRRDARLPGWAPSTWKGHRVDSQDGDLRGPAVKFGGRVSTLHEEKVMTIRSTPRHGVLRHSSAWQLQRREQRPSDLSLTTISSSSSSSSSSAQQGTEPRPKTATICASISVEDVARARIKQATNLRPSADGDEWIPAAAECLVGQPSSEQWFLESSCWRGARQGEAFKRGPRGVGYYLDVAPKMSAEIHELLCEDRESVSVRGVQKCRGDPFAELNTQLYRQERWLRQRQIGVSNPAHNNSGEITAAANDDKAQNYSGGNNATLARKRLEKFLSNTNRR